MVVFASPGLLFLPLFFTYYTLDPQVSSLESVCSLPLSRWDLGKGGEAVWSLAAAQGELTTPWSRIYQDELLQWAILECKVGYQTHVYNGVGFCYSHLWGNLHVNLMDQRREN